MNKIEEFINACGAYYVLTVNGDSPAGRPFGAIMEREEGLYFSTGAEKEVCRQLRAHANMQILAHRQGTRRWMRVSGQAEECRDLALRQELFEHCPSVARHFTGPEDPDCAIFCVNIIQTEFYG